jgi:hypothetical protein
MDSSAKLHGEGAPLSFECPACQGNEFVVSVQFDYSDACNDLVEDEPDIDVENYFCNFIVTGKCHGCGTVSRVLDMDL